jgi:hypothetical protein
MQVSLVPLQYTEWVWPKIEEYMKGAADYTYGRFDVEDIKKGVLQSEGNQQLWVAYENEEDVYGAVVTELWQYPKLRTLIMHFTGGRELPKWKDDMLKLLQQFAADQGCDVIESYGRGGWAKVFQNDGYKQRFIFYELPVE